MSDGTVKIETSLDNSGIEKDLKKVENTIQNSGKKIQSTMDNVEKSMKKASSSFDGSKIAKQLDSVGKSIDKTNSSIDKQYRKLKKICKIPLPVEEVEEDNEIADILMNGGEIPNQKA